MTAEKNVAFGLKQVKPDLSRKERLELANVYLQKVGLAEAGKNILETCQAVCSSAWP